MAHKGNGGNDHVLFQGSMCLLSRLTEENLE